MGNEAATIDISKPAGQQDIPDNQQNQVNQPDQLVDTRHMDLTKATLIKDGRKYNIAGQDIGAADEPDQDQTGITADQDTPVAHQTPAKEIDFDALAKQAGGISAPNTTADGTIDFDALAKKAGGVTGQGQDLPQFQTAPQKTDDLLQSLIAHVGFEDNDRYGAQAHDVAMAQAKVVSDYIYNNVLGKDTYIHNNLTYTPEPSSKWEWVKQHVWSPISDDTYNRYLAGAESDRAEMLKETGQDSLTQGILGTWAVSEQTGNTIRAAINKMPSGLPIKYVAQAISNVLFGVGRENSQYWRDHILNGNLVINQEPEVFARAAAKTLSDFYASPGALALRGFGMIGRGYMLAAHEAAAAGDMMKAAQLMKTARMMGLMHIGINLPFAGQQGIELAENWDKMSVAERVASLSAIASASISTQVGAMEHGGWREVGHTMSDAAKTTHQKAVEVAGGMLDSVARRRDNILDRATTFDEAMYRMAPTSDKKANRVRRELRQASPDLQAILTKSQPQSLNEFSQAIRDYYLEREKVMMAQAGASEHDSKPVTDTLYQDAKGALDKFFKESRGKYGTDEETAQAKKDLLELLLTSPGAGETGEAGPKSVKNLFQAENLRQELGNRASPKNLKDTNAFRAGAYRLGEVMRDAVDQRFDAEGIKNVKELREKERIGIEVADRLKVAQENADRMGNGSIWQALVKKYGMASVSSLIASAVGTVVGGPAGSVIGGIASAAGVGNLTGYLLTDARHQNRRNPNVNMRRAKKLAAPGARATDIEVQPGGQPPAAPGAGPAPAGGGPAGPAAPPSPATASATPPPPPPGAPGAPVVQPGVTPQPGAPGAPAAPEGAQAGAPAAHRFSNRAELRQQVVQQAAAPAAAEQLAFVYEPTPLHPSQGHPGPLVDLEPPPPPHEAADVAAKTAVLGMPDPPTNQDLNSKLASHLGDPSLSDRTLGDRIEAVKSEAEIMGRNGINVTDTKTGKALTEIHKYEAEQQAAIEQAQKKASDEAQQASEQINKEWQAEQDAKDAELEQQLRDSVAAARAAKEAREAEKAGETTEDGIRVPFKVGEELEPPKDPIMAMIYKQVGTPATHRAHEMAHAIVAEKVGLPVYGIISHEHARAIANNAIAETMMDQTSLMNDDGSMNWDKVRGRLGDVITTLVAGGIGEEIVYGTDFDSNKGVAGDRDVIKDVFDNVGIKDESERQRIIEAAKAYARELIAPHADRLATYSAAREEGTPRHLLIKSQTLEKFLGEVEQHGKETGDEEGFKTGVNRHGREGEPGAEEGDQGRVAGVRGQVRAQVKVTEKSTGDADTDALIRNAGGIPAGVWDAHEHGKTVMFHDPLTGTTLGFKPTEKVTPQNVGKKLAESRRQYGLKPEEIQMMIKGEAPAAEEEPETERLRRLGPASREAAPEPAPKTVEQERREDREDVERRARRAAAEKAPGAQSIPEKLAQKWGTTSDPLEAGFVLPDGRMIPLRGEHDEMLKGVGSTSYTPRESAIEDDKIVRTRFRKSRRGDEVVFSVPSSGVSPEQIAQMKKSVAAMGRYGNAVMEVGDPIAASVYNTTKEFVRPSDIEPMLRDIFAHPDQKGARPAYIKGGIPMAVKPGWHETAADRAQKEPAGAIDPRTGESATKGIGTEIVPEARQPINHVPNAHDFQSFHNRHGDLFDKHPELQIGWDNNSRAPGGHELNIGASGPGAADVARKLEQRAAFDLGKGEEIPTGGTGERTEFPEYSLEERLKDLKGGLPMMKKAKAAPEEKTYAENLADKDDQFIATPKGSANSALVDKHRSFLLGDGSILSAKVVHKEKGPFSTQISTHDDLVSHFGQKILHDKNAIRVVAPDIFEIMSRPTTDQISEIARLVKESGNRELHWDFNNGTGPIDPEHSNTMEDLRGEYITSGNGSIGSFMRAIEKTYPKGEDLAGDNGGGLPMMKKAKAAPEEKTYAENPEGLQHIRPELLEHVEPDERAFIKDNPRAQRKINEAYDNIKPTIDEIKAAIEAGGALGGWWKRFMDTLEALGADATPENVAKLAVGPSHAEALKAWHSALSGNKPVEDANHLAWASYAKWLDKGRPTNRNRIDNIITSANDDYERKTGKRLMALPDTHDNRGNLKHSGIDTDKLFRLVNSPQFDKKNPQPFHGDIFDPDNPSPVAGITSGARKIPSMVALGAGKGNLNRLVMDTHMLDLYGMNKWTDYTYIAHSIHMRQAARDLGLAPSEGQEQAWGTVLGIKKLLREGIPTRDIPRELTSDVIDSVGKDYADIMKGDPELYAIFEQLKKHGLDPGGERAQSRLAEILAEPRAVKEATVDKDLLTSVAERIKGRMSRVPEEKPSTMRLDFGKLPPLKSKFLKLEKPAEESGLDVLAGK